MIVFSTYAPNNTFISGSYKLTGDITLSSTLTIAADTGVTIDLCGYSISVTSGSAITVKSGATLIVKASSETTDGDGNVTYQGSITSSNEGSNYAVIGNSGTLYVYGGNIYATGSSAPGIENGGTLYVYGGNIYATGSSAPGINNGSTLYVYGGYIYATGDSASGISCTNSSKTYINGGYITTKYVSSGSSSISSASPSEIVITGGVVDDIDAGDSLTITGGTFGIVDCKGDLTITGGTFNSENSVRSSKYYVVYSSGKTATITGGTFVGGSQYTFNFGGNKSTVTIGSTGGDDSALTITASDSSEYGSIYVGNATASVTVESGTINGELYVKSGSLEITGGTYDEAAADSIVELIEDGIVAPNIMVESDGSGTYKATAYDVVLVADGVKTGYTDNGTTALEQAITAITGNSAEYIIILGANTILSSSWTIESGYNITLDLNGYTLSYDSSAYSGIYFKNSTALTKTYYIAGIVNKGILTITDSVGTGTIESTVTGGSATDSTDSNYTNYYYYGVILNQQGTVNIKSGTLTATGNSYTYGIYNYYGTVTVDGGTVSGVYGIYNYGGEVTLESGTVSAIYGIYNSSSGTVTVESGTISGTNRAISNLGTLYVEGGTLSGIYVIVNTGTVKISGGELTSTSWLQNGTNSTSGTLTVTGGTITGGTYGIWNVNGTVTITGGTISGTEMGVVVSSGTTEITGGTISGAHYYGVYASGTGTNVTIGGTATVTATGEGLEYYDKGNWIFGVYVLSGATVTIEDNATIYAEDDETTNTYSAGIAVYGPGAVSDGGEQYYSTLVVNGGTISGDTYGISGNGSQPSGSSTTDYRYTKIIINGGEIYGEWGIYHPQDGDLVINGGTITGNSTGIELRSGTFTMTGGTVISLTSPESVNPNGSGTTTVGVAVAISQHTTDNDIAVTITGGTLSGYYALYENDTNSGASNNKTDNIAITVTGGTFIGDVKSTTTNTGEGGTTTHVLTITGGTYTGITDDTDFANYVADGLQASGTKNNDGSTTYGITLASTTEETYVAAIFIGGSTTIAGRYTNLAAAFTDISDGWIGEESSGTEITGAVEIKLYADITACELLTLTYTTQKVTLNLNGYDLTFGENNVFYSIYCDIVNYGGNLTITSGNGNSTVTLKGGYYGIFNYGTLTITDNVSICYSNSSSEAIAIANLDTLIISGGTFNVDCTLIYTAIETEDVSVSISGGDFVDVATLIVVKGSVTVSISGGTYNTIFDVSYFASGYYAYLQKDDSYIVDEGTPVDIPTLSKTEYVYTGEEPTHGLGADGDNYTATVSANTVGLQTITITLADGYVWADGTTADITYSIYIAAAEIEVTGVKNYTYTYGNTVEISELTATTKGGAEATITYSYGTYSSLTDINTALSGANADTYTITYTVTAANHTAATGSFTVTINADKVEAPTPITTSETYSGETITFITVDETYYTVVGKTSASDANTYEVTLSLRDKNNYTWSDGTTADKVYTFTISKDTMTVTTENSSWTYGTSGSITAVTATGNNSTIGDYTVTYTYNGSTVDISNLSLTNAGTYTIYYSVSATNYETATGSFTVTISKQKVTISEVKQTTYDYTSEQITFITVESDACYTAYGTAYATDAGTYTVTLVLDDTDNYTWAAGTQTYYTFTINKIANEITVSMSGWTYGSAAVTPTVKVTGEQGIVTYAYYSDKECKTSVDITTANAGTYYVVATVAETSNYNSATSDPFEFEIEKAANSASVSITGWTYGETANAPTVIATYGTASVVYYSDAECTKEVDITTAGAGTYYVKATIAETANYAGATSQATFTIAKADITVTSTGYSGTYDGEEHYGIVTVSAASATVKYGTESGKYTLLSVPKYTTVGTYVVYYEVTADNYNSVYGSYMVVITKREIDMPEEDTTAYIYTGNVQTYGVKSNNFYTVSGGTQTGIGTYTVTITLNDTDNYMWSDGTTAAIKYVWIISGKVTAPAANNTVYVYNGSEQTYELATSTLYTISGNVQTNAGTYVVMVALTNTTDYTWSDGTTAALTYTFTINAATMTVTATGYSGNYDGNAHSGSVTVKENIRYTVNYGTTSGTYTTTTAPAYTEAGTYVVYYEVTADNYNSVYGSYTITITETTVAVDTNNTVSGSVTSDSGFVKDDVTIEMNVVESSNYSTTVNAITSAVVDKIAEVESAEVVTVYEITLTSNGSEVTVSEATDGGTIKVSVAIPTSLVGQSFYIAHIHNGEVIDVLTDGDYEVANGYVTFEVEHLSQFAFVAATDSDSGLSQGEIITLCAIIGGTVAVILLLAIALSALNRGRSNKRRWKY